MNNFVWEYTYKNEFLDKKKAEKKESVLELRNR